MQSMCLCLHRENKETLIKHMQSVGFSSFLAQQSQRFCSCDIQHVTNSKASCNLTGISHKKIGKKETKSRIDTESQ